MKILFAYFIWNWSLHIYKKSTWNIKHNLLKIGDIPWLTLKFRWRQPIDNKELWNLRSLNVISRFKAWSQCHFVRFKQLSQCQNQVKGSGVRHTGESESAYDRTAAANEDDARFQVKVEFVSGQICVILVMLTLAGQWHKRFSTFFSQTIRPMSFRSKRPRADGSS